jgi:hypothetical protein
MAAGSHRSPDAALERLRAVCFGFPGTEEKLSHGSPSFFVGGPVRTASLRASAPS